MTNQLDINFYWDQDNQLLGIEKEPSENLYIFRHEDNNPIKFIGVFDGEASKILLFTPYTTTFTLYFVKESHLIHGFNLDQEIAYIFNTNQTFLLTKIVDNPKQSIKIKTYIQYKMNEGGKLGLKEGKSQVRIGVTPNNHLTEISQKINQKEKADLICHTLYQSSVANVRQIYISPAFINKNTHTEQAIKLRIELQTINTKTPVLKKRLNKIMTNNNWATQEIIIFHIDLGMDHFQALKILKTMVVFRLSFQKIPNKEQFIVQSINPQYLKAINNRFMIQYVFNSSNVGYANHRDYIGFYSTSYDFNINLNKQINQFKNLIMVQFLGKRVIENQQKYLEIEQKLKDNKPNLEAAGLIYNATQAHFFSKNNFFNEHMALKDKLDQYLPTTLLFYKHFCDTIEQSVRLKHIFLNLGFNPSMDLNIMTEKNELLNLLIQNKGCQEQLIHSIENNDHYMEHDNYHFIQAAILIIWSFNPTEKDIQNNSWLRQRNAKMNACLYFWLDANLNIPLCINKKISAPEESFYISHPTKYTQYLKQLCLVNSDSLNSLAEDNSTYTDLKNFGIKDTLFPQAIKLSEMWHLAEQSLLKEVQKLYEIYKNIILDKNIPSLKDSFRAVLANYNNNKTITTLKAELIKKNESVPTELKPFFDQVQNLNTRVGLVYAQTLFNNLNQSDESFEQMNTILDQLMINSIINPEDFDLTIQTPHHIIQQHLKRFLGMEEDLQKWLWNDQDQTEISNNKEKIEQLLNALKSQVLPDIQPSLHTKALNFLSKFQATTLNIAVLIQVRKLETAFEQIQKSTPNSPDAEFLIEQCEDAFDDKNGLDIQKKFDDLTKLIP